MPFTDHLISSHLSPAIYPIFRRCQTSGTSDLPDFPLLPDVCHQRFIRLFVAARRLAAATPYLSRYSFFPFRFSISLFVFHFWFFTFRIRFFFSFRFTFFDIQNRAEYRILTFKLRPNILFLHSKSYFVIQTGAEYRILIFKSYFEIQNRAEYRILTFKILF